MSSAARAPEIRTVLDSGDEATRLARLAGSIGRHLGADVDVRPYRAGVDCFVDLVSGTDGVIGVARSARIERMPTSYEGVVDYGVLVEKEVTVGRLLAAAGVPTPEVYAWSRTADPATEPSWMLAQLVEHETIGELPSPELERTLGEVASRIHGIRPTAEARRVFEDTTPWEPWVVGRIMRRIGAARRYVDLPDDGAIEAAVTAAVAGRERFADALLHLDLRPPNLAVAGDRLLAVFDFGNSLIGDPLFELARVQVCRLLTENFKVGYGWDAAAAVAGSQTALLAYTLDLSALLVVVTKEEFDDPDLHARAVADTTSTLDTLLTGG